MSTTSPQASPSARRLAETLGVDLATLTGTGPGGRIRKEDVEAAAQGPRRPLGPAADERPEGPRPADV